LAQTTLEKARFYPKLSVFAQQVNETVADRAFYQEVNERLLRFKPEWGIPNCLFINAQYKQTVQTIMRPLRKLGIPTAAIVDVDVLKEGGTVWTNLLLGANIPPISHQSLATHRAALKSAMDATGRNMKRNGGIAILGDADREAARNLFTQLGGYGVFVVPGGELEAWLKALQATGHGPAWLINIFEKMGEDLDAVTFVKPFRGRRVEIHVRSEELVVEPESKRHSSLTYEPGDALSFNSATRRALPNSRRGAPRRRR